MENLKISMLVSMTLAALGAAACAQAAGQAATAGLSPKAAVQSVDRNWTVADSDVYVDRETGFAFVRTPAGWKFTRRVETEKMAQVPVEFFIPINARVGAIGALDTPNTLR